MQPAEHAKALSSTADDLNTEIVILHEEIPQRSDGDVVATLNGRASVLLAQFDEVGQRSQSLNNLAIALQTRFEQGGQQNDLDDSISMHRQALELRPLSHPDRSQSFNNLANALWI